METLSRISVISKNVNQICLLKERKIVTEEHLQVLTENFGLASNDLLDVKIAKSLVLGPVEHFQGFLWPTVGQVNTNFGGFSRILDFLGDFQDFLWASEFLF